MIERDTPDGTGENHSYMASEENFRTIKKMETENRIVPIVGDFAGDKALRSISRYLKAHGATVMAFYTSNVEFYLFGRSTWVRYIANLRGLPIADDSVFIRSYFPTYGRPHPLNVSGHRSTSLVQPMTKFLDQYDSRSLSSYWDVVKP